MNERESMVWQISVWNVAQWLVYSIKDYHLQFWRLRKLKSSMAEYRVGIVGCGGIAHFHGKNYNRFDEFEIVSVADINRESVDQYAEEFSVSGKHTNYLDMFEKEDLDVVSVCTWQGTHAEITIAAADSGVKGILCEKPMAINLGEADAMIEACDQSGVKLVVGHQRRFEAIYTEAQKLIADGIIGQPITVTRRVGSGLLNWGTHVIDLTRQILGDPETKWVIGQVERKTDRYERRCEIEDLCAGIICFENDTRFVLEIDMPPPYVNNIFVHGSDGILTSEDGKLKVLNGKEGWQTINPASDGEDQWSEFLAWLDGRVETHRCSGKQASYTIEIMMAIYESVRTKGLVEMPLKTKESPLIMMISAGTLPVEKSGKYDIRVPF